MSLNLFYSLREGIVGLRRARLATLITISTVTITLTLLGIFLVLTVNIHRIVEIFRERMVIEVFMDASLTDEEIRILQTRIEGVEGVGEVVFVSREMALERFREEFGEDPLALLGENPLPPSFQVKLKSEHRSANGIEVVARTLDGVEGVEEVVYHGRLFRIVDRYSRIVLVIDGVLLTVVLLSVVLLVANTLRLTILAQGRTIQIMELVGATEGFIRRPYLIQGILQGGVGGGVGSIVVWGLVGGIAHRFPRLIHVSPLLILTPLFLGLVLGYLGSRVGLSRFLRGY